MIRKIFQLGTRDAFAKPLKQAGIVATPPPKRTEASSLTQGVSMGRDSSKDKVKDEVPQMTSSAAELTVEGKGANAMAELDSLADAFSSGRSVVDDWLAKNLKRPFQSTAKLPLDYTSEAYAARPPRLGIGAKPSSNTSYGLGEDTGIVGAYKLRAQLTGGKVDGKRGPLNAIFMSDQSRKMGKTAGSSTAPLRPLKRDEDEESRAKSVGKGASMAPRGASIVPSYHGVRKKRQN